MAIVNAVAALQPEAAPRPHSVDPLAAHDTVRDRLAALGGDPLGDRGLRRTPRRVAAAFALPAREPFTPTTVPDDAGPDERVDGRDSLPLHAPPAALPRRRERRLRPRREDRRAVEARTPRQLYSLVTA